MQDFKRASLLVTLVDELRDHDSWCGETHVQKAVYVLEELHGVPLDLAFILYKHGPFSFDLRDELSALRADGLLDLETCAPYGPRFLPTESGRNIVERFPKTVREHRGVIRRVAERMGSRNVGELERLATALFVVREERAQDTTARIERLLELKPHVSRPDAEDAVREMEEWLTAEDSAFVGEHVD